MKVIINIPQELFEDIQAGYYAENVRRMAIAIGNGTPLPKGHGRLGDLDALKVEMSNGIKAGLMIEGYESDSNINDMDDCLECVKYAPTIIEADTESEDKK